jgi:hypothetical protein
MLLSAFTQPAIGLETRNGSVAKIILARKRSQATLSQAAIWNSGFRFKDCFSCP